MGFQNQSVLFNFSVIDIILQEKAYLNSIFYTFAKSTKEKHATGSNCKCKKTDQIIKQENE